MKRAFTLIEILIVVVIISILAGLLFPIFGSAKRKGQETVDISNMRQLYTGVMLYEGDNNEGNPVILSLVLPYVKDTRVFRSPMDAERNMPSGGFPARMFRQLNSFPERIPFQLSYGYLGGVEPWCDDKNLWQRFRGYSNMGMIASLWSGAVVGRPAEYDVLGPVLNGPILRIKMDGSLFRLPQNRDVGMIGSTKDFFFIPEKFGALINSSD